MHCDPLHATPEDTTPDSGPRRHGGTFVILAALMATLTAFFGAGLAHEADRPGLVVPALILFGLPSAWWWRCAWVYWHDRTPLPRSHSVLAGTLGFDLICTCRGVASTVFFHPDQASVGDDLELFVFLENYTSRRRTVQVRVGPHAGLGLPRLHSADLHLAAGQTAVYRFTVRSEPTMIAGEHDVPVVLRVHGPEGVGRRLPGTRRPLYDIWHTRFAAPFTLTPAAAETASASANTPEPPPAPVYVTLASVSDPQPDLHALQDLAVPGWLKAVRKTTPPSGSR